MTEPQQDAEIIPQLEQYCETAEDLLHALDPTHKDWGKGPDAWCVRGQSDDYPLTPSALRSKARKPGSLLARTNGISGLVERFGPNEEYRLLDEFRKTADRAGLAIPHDSPTLRGRRLSDVVAPGADYLAELKGWPPDEVLAVLALAQHYGVPTRLLDWSYRPLVAAYFAAKDVAKAMWEAEQRMPHDRDLADPERPVVVWALNTAWLDLLTDTLRRSGANVVEHHLGPLPRITQVEAPQATNPNLAAQAGTFTVDRLAAVDGRFNEDLAALISDELTAWNDTPGTRGAQLRLRGRAIMRKLALPRPQARRLLRIVGLMGVHAATVFPGHQSVVTSMHEKYWWQP